ncbi:MAG: cellulase family glycosylhydrolase [Clostridiales bacterium]|nr:cellulase family glycosylhydrolase [Clostridiales bacterium]
MKRTLRCIMSLALVFAMVLTIFSTAEPVSAATKTVKLGSDTKTAVSMSLKVGNSKKVKVKQLKSGTIKKITWTSKDESIATVEATSKRAAKITAKKTGTVKVVGKVKYTNKKGKTKTKKLVVKVKVKAAGTGGTSDMDTSNLTTEHKSANGITTKDNGQMRKELTSADYMEFMGQGINLGNTLEACTTDTLSSATAYETCWGMPVTTQAMIDGMKSYGYNTVRIPVAWSNMISDDGTYTINDEYLDRVEEVINYVLNDEMYAIINIHYDSDWWGQFGDADQSVRDEAWARYESFWTQIANRYAEYSDRLIFESANEELGDRLNDNWVNQDTNNKTGTLTEDECYELTNEINQKFVDIVRASGGNNAYRYLLIAGYNTDIDMTCDSRFVMPTDTAENGTTKLSVSIHYYTPSTYCIADSSSTWGYDDTWGTSADIQALHDNLDKMKKFTDAGYGVIIGEFGVTSTTKDGIADFTREVMTYGAKCGYVPVLWDTNTYYNRTAGQMKYKDIAQVVNDVTGANGPISDSMETTGIKSFDTGSEDDLTLMYTWTGTWQRTSGNDGGFTTKTCDDGLTVQSNVAFWQLWLTTDWSQFNEPYIKVTAGSDSTSKSANLQLWYVSKADDANWVDQINIAADDNWSGSCIALDLDNLTGDTPWIGLSSETVGAQFVKIEIYDKK